MLRQGGLMTMKRNSGGYTEFGKQAKIKMVLMNLSSRELAKKLGYKESTLCDVLKGRNRNNRRIEEIMETLLELQHADREDSA